MKLYASAMGEREERIDLIYHLHHFHDLLLFVPRKLFALVVTFSTTPHDPKFFLDNWKCREVTSHRSLGRLDSTVLTKIQVKAPDWKISSWVYDHQRIPAVVCFWSV